MKGNKHISFEWSESKNLKRQPRSIQHCCTLRRECNSAGFDALGEAGGLLEETSLETDSLYPFVSYSKHSKTVVVLPLRPDTALYN